MRQFIVICGILLLMVSIGYAQQTTEQLLRESLDPGEPMPDEETVETVSPEIEAEPIAPVIDSATETVSDFDINAEQIEDETEEAELTLSELIRMQSEEQEEQQEEQETESAVISGTPSFEYDVEYPSREAIDRETAMEDFEAAERAEDVTQAIPIYEIAVGEKSMPFTLPTSMGKEVSVPEGIDAGRIVLAFFRGPWDPYAEEQLKKFAVHYEDIEVLGAKVVAISAGSPQSLAAMRRENLLPFPVLVDEDFNVSRAFKTYRASMRMIFPALYILNRDGTILFFQRGQMGTDYVQIEQLTELLEKYESQ